MASVTREKNGTARIIWSIGGDERRGVRLGRVSDGAALNARVRIERILQAQALGEAMGNDEIRWLRALDDRIHNRCARAGLCPPRAVKSRYTLGEMLAAFFESLDSKASAVTRAKTARLTLTRHFGEDRDVRSIGEADAEDWKTALRKDGYAGATIGRTVKYARQFWTWAKRRGMVDSNPFVCVTAPPTTNPSRITFVDRETVAKVIDAAPDDEWRLLIALARYCGLRTPSEPLLLTWGDIDWQRSRIRVRVPKLEHHEGRGERWVPIFPEVRPYLQRCFDDAEPGQTWVIARYRQGQNINPQLHRLIKAAGLKAWPRAWNALRASRQMELCAEYPLHVACEWLGNSRLVAAGHYLKTTDADFQRATGGGAGAGAPEAVQKAVRTGGDSTTPDATRESEKPRSRVRNRIPAALGAPVGAVGMGLEGVEPSTSPLSGVRSSHLSYKPVGRFSATGAHYTPLAPPREVSARPPVISVQIPPRSPENAVHPAKVGGMTARITHLAPTVTERYQPRPPPNGR